MTESRQKIMWTQSAFITLFLFNKSNAVSLKLKGLEKIYKCILNSLDSLKMKTVVCSILKWIVNYYFRS